MRIAIALYLTLVATVIFQEEAAPLAGALAAHHEHLDPLWVAIACASGTWFGDLALYWLGRRGSKLLRRPSFAKALEFVRRHPRAAPLAVRFAYGLRFTLPIACGAARLSPWAYAFWVGVSAVSWASLFTVVGWSAGELALRLFHDVQHYELPLIALVLLSWLVIVIWRRARRGADDSEDRTPSDATASA